MDRKNFRKLVFTLTDREKKYMENSNLSSDFYQALENNGIKNPNGTFNFLTFKHMNDLGISNCEDSYNKKSHASICLNGNIILKKQNRYSKVPLHSHEFIGINYVYSGKTKVYTLDNSIDLDEGSIFLMDSNFIHTLEVAKENDIILNIQIDPQYLNNSIITRLYNSGIVGKFLLDSFKNKNDRNHFLIFNCKNNERLKTAFEDMFCESFNPTLFSYELIENYLHIIFIEMIRNYSYEEKVSPETSNSCISEILHYINENLVYCNLESVSKHFNFNSKYLSRVIKSATGKTFKDIHLEMRMNKALSLIRNSSLSIDIIAEECGYKNKNFFYKKFQELYNTTPASYRKFTKKDEIL